MFQVNDYVIYGKNGVCNIIDICIQPFEGADKNTEYYVLKPVNSKGSTIYTPVENNKVVMRNIMTREEAMDLIHKVADMDPISVENDKYREAQYRNSMMTGDSEELIKIIKTIFIRKQKSIEAGKKMSATDEKYLRQAEDSLYGELSYTFELSEDEVKDYFIEQVRLLEKL